MTKYLIENSLLNKNQHGFMLQKSSATNLIESFDILTDALNNDKSVDVVYTDFFKAFDKVDHDHLLLKTRVGLGRVEVDLFSGRLRSMSVKFKSI